MDRDSGNVLTRILESLLWVEHPTGSFEILNKSGYFGWHLLTGAIHNKVSEGGFLSQSLLGKMSVTADEPD